MKLAKDQIKLLGLTSKEVSILDTLRSGKNTPLKISQITKISRPAIYEILTKLHKRGLVKTNIVNGKKYWSQAKDRDLEQELYSTKKQLLNISEGVEETHGLSDSIVIVHKGVEAVQRVLMEIVKNNKGQRLFGIQGDRIILGWNKIFGSEKINEFNNLVKENEIITEFIVPPNFFERGFEDGGKSWAQNFMGRMSISHEIEDQYFEHGGQIFIFKNSLYLIAMNEEVVIEVRNSEIQKLLLSMHSFIQDNSKKFDTNKLLKEIIGEED